jgi:O-antigen/teichoic acid export membrane protein
MAYHTKIGSLREWHYDYDYALFLLKESFPLLLTNAAVIIYQRIDQVMIGNMIDKTSVGFFSVAGKFTEVLIFLPMILAQTITPVLVKARERDVTEYQAKAQQFMNFSFWLSLLLSAFVSVISYWLISYTFGPAYLPAIAILQIMAFKAASVALSNTAGAMLVTEGLQRWAICRDGLGCIVCIVLNYYLLPRYGVIAAAFVSIASNIAAGYLADALIPAYRHLFVCQTRALLLGWKDLFRFKSLLIDK